MQGESTVKFFFFFRIVIAVSAASIVIAGCAAGPDFHSPPSPSGGYTAEKQPAETDSAPVDDGQSQRFIIGQTIAEEWWTIFKCQPLDRLIREALAESPTSAAAIAALRQAEENRRALAGQLLPGLNANLSGSRQQITGASYGQPDLGKGIFTLYNASVNISYTLDLSGSVRRSLEALGAQVDYQRYVMEGAYLTLASNIITAAIKEASLRAQIDATQEIIATQDQQLKLVQRRFQLGSGSQPDVLAQEARLAQTQASLPALKKALAQTRNQLSVLAGKSPGEEAMLPEFKLEDLALPTELPVSLPSFLARQRPDIRASEALLHAASAQIGVATANLFPTLSISGDYGSQSTVLHDLFSGNASIWNIGAGLTAPVFRGGELTAKRRAAIAAYDQAEAEYKQTVLQGFQNVADVLQALEEDARALNAQANSEKAARNTLELTQKQYEIGATSYLTMLNAQQLRQQTEISLVQAKAARFADTAALFQALGGGWWNRESKID